MFGVPAPFLEFLKPQALKGCGNTKLVQIQGRTSTMIETEHINRSMQVVAVLI